MADSMGQTPGGFQQAKSRLEQALERLEKAVAARPAADGDGESLAAELGAARQEIARLKEANAAASNRLDATIAKVKTVLGD